MAKSRKTEAKTQQERQERIDLQREYKPVPRFGGGCKNC